MRQPKMTHWYTPWLALRTGIRVALSSVFGEFADRREIVALQNPVASDTADPALDYRDRSDKDGLWLDYMADTGDGFDATYAMARLLGRDSLTVEGAAQALPHADVVVLGGDQVYPDPSLDAYRRRLVNPLVKATHWRKYGTPGPDLYALPGNHDWYDGLMSFGQLFCRRRIAVPGQATVARAGKMIGKWSTQQTRSYFALKLPGNWWLWGVDTQLGGFMDKPQVEYFTHIGSIEMEPGANVILAVAAPAWVGSDADLDGSDFNLFDYILRLPESCEDADGKVRGHKVRLVLTGDHHHYARYEEISPSGETGHDGPRILFISGGGGAFLHPTHHLAAEETHRLNAAARRVSHIDRRSFRIARPGGQEALYPPRADSRRLSQRNLLFAFLNPEMTASFLAIYVFFIWTLSVWSTVLNGESLIAHIGDKSWSDAMVAYVVLIAQAPFHVAIILTSFSAFFYFAGKSRPAVRWVAGGLHWLAQTICALLVGWATIQLMHGLIGPGRAASPPWEIAIVVIGAAAAALASGTIMGIYLLVSLNIFGRHFNEAFSSIRIDRYRNFLRLHIDAAGRLAVYPIGLRDIPGGRDAAKALKPHLIEPPITFEP